MSFSEITSLRTAFLVYLTVTKIVDILRLGHTKDLVQTRYLLVFGV